MAALTLIQFTNVREATRRGKIHNREESGAITSNEVYQTISSDKTIFLELLREVKLHHQLTKTQAGDEFGGTLWHGTAGVQRFQKVGGKHQRHHILRRRSNYEHLHPQL